MSIEITNILVDVWFQRLDTTVAEKRIESITEAYADARVREALEEAVMILKANAEACHSDTGIMLRANAEAIRALIQDPPCST